MEMSETRPLVLAWWNTSLSPLGKPRKTPADSSYVLNFVRELVRTLGVDILALGEVCSQDVSDIIRAIGDPRLSFHDATLMDGERRFDTAILFDRRRLSLDASVSVLDSYGKSTLKVGEKVRLLSFETGEYLHLFVSHWPSRLYCSETSPRRTEIGTSLRKALDDIRSGATSRQFIVLMGDYNDDPCSPSLANHLLATRDRDLARENDKFLYNPFWRRLGEAVPFVVGQTLQSICGTCYYAGGETSRWFTFDQMMFSSAFLRDGPFVLNEEHSMIVRSDDLESRIRSSGEVLDHLPVAGIIDIRRKA